MKTRMGSKKEELQRAKEILKEAEEDKKRRNLPPVVNLIDEEEEVTEEENANHAPFQTKSKKKTPPRAKGNPNHQPPKDQGDIHPLHAGLRARRAQAKSSTTGQGQSQDLPMRSQQQQQQQQQQQVTTKGTAQWLQSQDFSEQRQQALDQKRHLEQQQQEREEAFRKHQQEEQEEFAREQEELMQSVCQIQSQLSQPPNPLTPASCQHFHQPQQFQPQAHCASEESQLRMRMQRQMATQGAREARPTKKLIPESRWNLEAHWQDLTLL